MLIWGSTKQQVLQLETPELYGGMVTYHTQTHTQVALEIWLMARDFSVSRLKEIY